jgi:hypothetical protein
LIVYPPEVGVNRTKVCVSGMSPDGLTSSDFAADFVVVDPPDELHAAADTARATAKGTYIFRSRITSPSFFSGGGSTYDAGSQRLLR